VTGNGQEDELLTLLQASLPELNILMKQAGAARMNITAHNRTYGPPPPPSTHSIFSFSNCRCFSVLRSRKYVARMVRFATLTASHFVYCHIMFCPLRPTATSPKSLFHRPTPPTNLLQGVILPHQASTRYNS
jgi:hypothetical protein